MFHMETERLKQFCTLFELKSLTKASKVLGITHSGLHKSMKQLEIELNVELTVSDGRGIKITEEGHKLYSLSKEVIERTDFLKHNLSTNKECLLRFSGTEPFSITFFSKVLKLVERSDMSFHERCPRDVEQGVLDSLINMGVTLVPYFKEGLVHEKIGFIKMGLFGKKKM